ncbi:BatA domain-containing protein [Planctomicrobium sp. SH664]|uniref:BatA domain-containing protein n=1 Tax=Planctomicrobium sp. SH664 TaxID=3448125 RepID=UPI003F5B9496
MTFLNSAILIGLGFVAVPVLLHFLMRQKPRKLLFPALRLLQQRRQQNVRRMRLRHVWLMLFRMLVLALIVLAVARPSLPAANYALSRFELIVLLLVAAAGVGGYFLSIRSLNRSGESRFQQEQERQSRRSWATAATLGALLLCVGCPYQRRISAEIRQPETATQLNVPVAGILLFDNSLSMSYLQAGKTVLNRAQQVARAHLEALPSGSRVAVSETGADYPILFQSTLLSAQTRIDSLHPRAASRPLDDRLREALHAQEEDRKRVLTEQGTVAEDVRKDLYLRRIYLFTDLAKSAWRSGGSSLLKAELERLKGIHVYVIDVGEEQGKNEAILEVTPSRELIPVGGDLSVTTVAQAQGEDADAAQLELLFQGQNGNLVKQGQTQLRLDQNLPARTEFPQITGLTVPWINGQVRFSGTDPLTFDNVRYFTAEVREPPQVLVLAPRRADAFEWLAALAPLEGAGAVSNNYKPRYEPISRLKELDLGQFATVTLINAPRLTDDAWQQLGQYVESGGGLIVVLGSTDISAAAYNRAPAQQFLPAWLDSWQPKNEWRFSIDQRNHPLFATFRRLEPFGSFAILENNVVVERFWKVKPAEGAAVLATYTDVDRSPAIVEKRHGKGRSVVLTTAANLPENRNERWNNLPSPLIDAWLFLALVEQFTDYASSFAGTQHAFTAGQTIAIRLPPEKAERVFLLREPNLKQSRRTLAANESLLQLKDVTEPGHYELVKAENPREIVSAFSINVTAAESDLTRLTRQDLDSLLGEDRYRVARNLDELKDEINATDIGQEVYPVLLMILVVIFCGELLLANRFYQTPGEALA